MKTTEYRWIAVRDYFNPMRVIGFLRLTSEQFGSHAVTLAIESSVTLEIMEMCDFPSSGHYVSERAIISKDQPLEFWRAIPDFVEAVECP